MGRLNEKHSARFRTDIEDARLLTRGNSVLQLPLHII